MASIRYNGETIHLKPQAFKDFQGLTGAVFRGLKEDEPVQGTVMRVLADALKKGQAMDGPIVQTTFWMLHDLGVRAVTLDLENNTANLDEFEETEAARGDARWMGVANIESGRAYAAALVNIHRRGMLVNGTVHRCFPQPREEVQKIAQQINANRLVNEDLVFTAARAIGALLKQGKGPNDVEFKCAIEIASGLGIVELVVDMESGKLALRQFSESNAAATALLSGADAKQVQGVRERIKGFNTQLEDLRKRIAAGEKLEPMGNRPVPPPPLPGVIGNRRTTRRRG
jgi:hypothetical protein